MPSSIVQMNLERVILTGFMGAGKSTVGRLLAERIGWKFLDLDTHIECVTGKSAKELFADLGEAGFRRLESQVFAEALRQAEVIIAPGGAVIDKSENQAALASSQGSYTIFLDAPFETLIARCIKQEQLERATYRPLLHQEAIARARYDARRVLYAAHAQSRVDVADATPQEVLQHILEAISQF
jgi:shikimate kinase